MNFTGVILLVDDEPHIRKYLGLVLKQFGTPVILEAANGEEAVEVYRRENPDLVLLDVNMPKMDGMATLRKLREIDPRCLVIMLTSVANRATVEQAIEIGAVNYIRKDTSRDEISQALHETIGAYFDLGVPPTA
jgi:two-component system chemotaxis response regulator CheY